MGTDSELTRTLMKIKIENEKKLLPEFEEMAKLVAKKQRIYYKSLINEGFEDRQAIELVEESGIHANLSYFSDDGDAGENT